MFLNLDSLLDPIPSDSYLPLGVDEVIIFFRARWGVSYDLQLVVRNNHLYLQVMWGYLEQQSFPLDEQAYRNHLNEVLEVVNRLGQAKNVREWLFTNPQKPRLGHAITFRLKVDGRLSEFVLGTDQ